MVPKTSFNNWPIALKLNVIQSVALAALLIFAITWLTRTLVAGNTEAMQQINHETLNMIRVYDESLGKNIERMGNILKGTLPSDYTLDTTQRITVVNAQAPVLKVGGETLNLNFGPVDRFTAISGAVATIFVRDGDDFVRITTSLKNESGERAIGTKLDGDHPARAALLANRPFSGRASLFGREYMTRYVPVHDARGAVVGSLFVGLDFTSELQALQEKNS
jgi:methyl-accepting chemotaxis protein-2 (aspartate sensor receptor)